MEQIKVFDHPTNPLRTVIFHLKKSMKMLAVNEDLEEMSNLKPAKNFFKATFSNEERMITVHFCVMHQLRSLLYWNDQLIIDAVSAYNDKQQIGILQTLIETLPDRVMFELQQHDIAKVA